MPSVPTLLRGTAAVSVVAGLVHLVVPNVLLGLARWSYDRVLAVRFEPRTNATRRVRLVGFAMVLSALVLTNLAARIE